MPHSRFKTKKAGIKPAFNGFLTERYVHQPANTAHQRQESKEFKSQVAADEAEIMASQLKKVKLVIKVQTGEDGRVFGSVTARDISEALKQQYKFDFDKKKIMLDQPIKAVGEYDVDLWVHPKVKGTIHVSVVAE